MAERQDCIVDEDYDSLPEEASSCGSIELPGMDNIAINNDYHIHADTSALSADHLLQSTIALPKMSFEAYAAPSQPVASTDSFETDSNPSSTLFDGLSLGYENPFSVDDVAWSGEEGVPIFFDSPSTMNEEGGFLYPASNREVSNPFMLYWRVCCQDLFSRTMGPDFTNDVTRFHSQHDLLQEQTHQEEKENWNSRLPFSTAVAATQSPFFTTTGSSLNFSSCFL